MIPGMEGVPGPNRRIGSSSMMLSVMLQLAVLLMILLLTATHSFEWVCHEGPSRRCSSSTDSLRLMIHPQFCHLPVVLLHLLAGLGSFSLHLFLQGRYDFRRFLSSLSIISAETRRYDKHGKMAPISTIMNVLLQSDTART